jgi:hypothetical protein
MSQYDKVFLPPNVDFGMVRDGRRSPLFYYDVDLTNARSIGAGTAETLPLAGDVFMADMNPDLQGDAVVHFQDTNLSSQGAPVYVTRGAIWKLPFTKMLIENAAQPGKRLRFFYGVGVDAAPGASSSVNIAGTVSVIDGGKARTLSNIAFMGGTSRAAGGAGVYSWVQARNTSAAVRVFVEAVTMQVTGADGMTLYVGSPAAATLVAALKNKNAGGADGNCKLYTDATVGHPGTALLGLLQVNLPASSSYTYRLAEPICLENGESLTAAPSTPNNACGMSLECYEEAV